MTTLPKVYPLDKVPLDEEYDLIYALHMFLFPALLSRGLKYKKAISATLSAFGGIELVPPHGIWPYFDLITAISEEVAQAYHTRFDISDIFTIVPNHIPLSFMNSSPKSQKNKNIQKVAVISNHYVPELFLLSRLAPFKVDLIGSLYRNSQRITPELLKQYDALITIGKTVQYSLGLGIPVFQYDKYGGCGYILPENIDYEEKTNFSGRGTKRSLSPGEIIAEIQDGYIKACNASDELCALSRSRYDIKKLIDNQLQTIMGKDKERPPIKKDALLFSEGANSILEYLFAALSLSERKLD